MNETSTAILSPAAVAEVAEDAMIHKATNQPWKAFLLALSGGGYIALGFVFFVTAVTGSGVAPWGWSRVLGGVVFSTGLFLVVVTGAELFTSTSMTLIAKAAGAISWRQLLRHWAIVYVGNAVGALTIAGICYVGGVPHNAKGEWGTTLVATASAKLAHSPLEAFVLGIGCNLVVCLAVWAAFTGRTTTDKLAAVVLPIALFVAVGFEHSVANMFLIPLALFVGGGTADLTWGHFLLGNLLPVTLGNIIGGGVMIGLYYWVIHRWKRR